MKLLSLPIAALLLATPAQAQDAPLPLLNLEQRMLVRCSAAFAMVAFGQDNGNAEAMQYPPLQERGQEFFVRSSARVMDEAQLPREELARVMEHEAQVLWDNQQIDEIMPVCLQLLEQSGL